MPSKEALRDSKTKETSKDKTKETSKDKTKETPREGPKVSDTSMSTAEDTEEAEVPQWRRLQMRSSTIFSQTMTDFEAKMQDRLRKQHEAMLARQRQEHSSNTPALAPIEDDLEDDDYSDDEDDGDLPEEVVKVDPHKEQVKKSAHRAWLLIKRYINEQRMKNKNQNSAMNWSFLKQTLSNMTNMEKAREDLYQKYLYNSDPNEWTQGLSHIPERLLQKRQGRREEKQHTPSRLPLKKHSQKKTMNNRKN